MALDEQYRALDELQRLREAAEELGCSARLEGLQRAIWEL